MSTGPEPEANSTSTEDKPTLDHLRRFGCAAWKHISKSQRLDAKAGCLCEGVHDAWVSRVVADMIARVVVVASNRHRGGTVTSRRVCRCGRVREVCLCWRCSSLRLCGDQARQVVCLRDHLETPPLQKPLPKPLPKLLVNYQSHRQSHCTSTSAHQTERCGD